MKKFLSFFLIFVFIVTMLPTVGFNQVAVAETDGDFSYTVYNGEATITSVSELISGEVVIPSTLGGCPVTSISANAFDYCRQITSVTIPNCVNQIGVAAFMNCDKLVSITLPFVGASRIANNSVDAVFGYIFGYNDASGFAGENTTRQLYNSGASEDYYIPSSLRSVTITDATHLPYGAFFNCSNLTNINISSNVTDFFDFAFYNCSSLTNITIPNSVKTIGIAAFENCDTITTVTIPGSVTSIVESFPGCDKLENIIVDENNAYYTSVDGVLFNKNKTVLVSYPANKANKNNCYVVPESVETIADYSFFACAALQNITLGKNIKSVGFRAFYGCSGLKNVYYAGEDRSAIDIGNVNETLTSAVWYYNSCLNSETHTYNGYLDVECSVCGTTRVIESIAGDINGDLAINLKDLVVLAQFVAEWNGMRVNEATIDVNGDALVDLQDVTYLACHLAGWEDYIPNINENVDQNPDAEGGDVDMDMGE